MTKRHDDECAHMMVMGGSAIIRFDIGVGLERVADHVSDPELGAALLNAARAVYASRCATTDNGEANGVTFTTAPDTQVN